MANILTIDLPDDDDPGPTPGGVGGAAEEEQDELDTPLAARWAKSSAERAGGWASGGSGRGSEERRGGGGGGGADKRSRLAVASGPREQAEAAHGGGAAAPAEVREVEAMEIEGDAAPAAQQEQQQQQQQQQAMEQYGAQQQETEQEAQQREEEERRREQELRAKGVAERFSVRQLVRHPERPVVLHKGTPLPGSLPPSPDDRCAAEAWAGAGQAAHTRCICVALVQPLHLADVLLSATAPTPHPSTLPAGRPATPSPSLWLTVSPAPGPWRSSCQRRARASRLRRAPALWPRAARAGPASGSLAWAGGAACWGSAT